LALTALADWEDRALKSEEDQIAVSRAAAPMSLDETDEESLGAASLARGRRRDWRCATIFSITLRDTGRTR
jgi:hypothetical protein